MKKKLNSLLKFLVVLFAFSFAIPSFGQPPIRQETRGGSPPPDGPLCELTNNGEDQVLSVCIYVSDYSYFLNCDFQIGYELINSDMIYVDVDNWNQNALGEWYFCFNILMSGQEISDMCDQGIDYVQLDFFCLENGLYENIYDELFDPAEIIMCCDRNPNGLMKPKSTINSFELEVDKDYKVNSKETATDYYIFDIFGNQINISKNISTELSLQQHISTLNIRSGIYIVKYQYGQEIKSEKVYKY